MVLDSGSSPLLAAPGRVPAETVLPKKTLFFSLSENGGGEDTHADAGRALSSGVCASWRSSVVLGAGDLFVGAFPDNSDAIGRIRGCDTHHLTEHSRYR